MLTLIGVAIALVGITLIGFAGALKNKNLSDEERKAAVKEFALKKGLLIALLSGVMSASFAFGFQAGIPSLVVFRDAIQIGPTLSSQRKADCAMYLP